MDINSIRKSIRANVMWNVHVSLEITYSVLLLFANFDEYLQFTKYVVFDNLTTILDS